MEVIGIRAVRSKSGKTEALIGLTRELIKKGRRVASVKHIPRDNFSLNTEGKDTWKHSQAGANPVVGVTSKEETYFYHPAEGISLSNVIKRIALIEKDLDYILVEGFKKESIPHIIAANSPEDARELIGDKTIALIGKKDKLEDLDTTLPVVDIRNPGELVKILENKESKIKRVLESLPGLDCGECGLTGCGEMAEKIAAYEKDFNDCAVIAAGREVEPLIGGKEVPMGGFVQDFMKNTFLGMIKTLKKVDLKEGDEIQLKIRYKGDKK